jgi:hypothetical protein
MPSKRIYVVPNCGGANAGDGRIQVADMAPTGRGLVVLNLKGRRGG